MHIGDSIHEDVLPALRAGWDAILLDRSSDQPVAQRVVDDEGSEVAVTVINSLDVSIMRRLVSKERIASVFKSGQLDVEMAESSGLKWERQRKERRRTAALRALESSLARDLEQAAETDATGPSIQGWKGLGKGLKGLK